MKGKPPKLSINEVVRLRKEHKRAKRQGRRIGAFVRKQARRHNVSESTMRDAIYGRNAYGHERYNQTEEVQRTGTHKLCVHCGNWKQHSRFSIRRDGAADGLQSYCKDCANEVAIKNKALRRKRKKYRPGHAYFDGVEYVPIYTHPYGFTPEATRAGIERAKRANMKRRLFMEHKLVQTAREQAAEIERLRGLLKDWVDNYQEWTVENAKFVPVVKRVRGEWIKRHGFPDAPCPFCGYSGKGYYQPDAHPCVISPKNF